MVLARCSANTRDTPGSISGEGSPQETIRLDRNANVAIAGA